MRCKYTKLFLEKCNALQISCGFTRNLQCIAFKHHLVTKLFPQHELLHHLRFIVREEEAVLQVESGDANHLVCRQFEVEDVEVLFHTLLMSALRDDDDTTLNQESQCRLGESLAMRLAYLCEHLIVEEIVQALGKWSPRIEVAHTDGSHLALTVSTLHRTISAIVVAKRLMDKQQVDIVALQFFQAFEDAGISLLLACIGNPNLGHDEEFLTRHTTLLDGIAHTLLVMVSLCRINHSIAHADGIEHTTLAFRRTHLIHAIAHLRHLHTIIQCNPLAELI